MKPQTTQWGLKFGHPTPFRRTVKIGEGTDAPKVQLVFEPDTPYELTDEEVEGCADIIKNGLLVPWQVDGKGRRATPLVAARQSAEARVKELELDVAALEEQVALLIEQVKELGGEPVVEADTEVDEADAGEQAAEGEEAKPKRSRRKKADAGEQAAE